MPPPIQELNWAGAGIDAATNLISQAFNNKAISNQNQANLDLWNKQNEYNHPKNQIARLREAGINPHIYFGGGGGNSGTASAPPTQNANSLNLQNFGSIVRTYLELKKQDTDIENTRTDTDNKIIEGGLKGLDYDLQTYKMGHWDTGAYEDGYDLRYFPAIQEYKDIQEKRKQEIELLKKGIPIKEKDFENKKFDLDMKEMMKFIPEGERRAYDLYGWMPDDTNEIKFFKMLAKANGMKYEEFAQKFFGFLKFLK